MIVSAMPMPWVKPLNPWRSADMRIGRIILYIRRLVSAAICSKGIIRFVQTVAKRIRGIRVARTLCPTSDHYTIRLAVWMRKAKQYISGLVRPAMSS